MDLVCLDERFQVVGYLPYINLQWTRRYFECGEFSAQIRMQDYDESVRYLYTPDRPETGMVEKVHTESDITGHYVQMSGRFLEGMLDRSVVWPAIQTDGKPSALARWLVEKYAADIPGLAVTAHTAGAEEEKTAIDFCGENLADVTWPLLKLCGRSQRIRYDPEGGRLVYSIWQGLDRTQSQSVNPYALFSDMSGDTERITIDEDESGWRNYALIGLSDGKSMAVDLRGSEAEPRRMIFLDERSSAKSGDQTEAQFRAELLRKARTALANAPRIINVEAATIQNGLFYRTDYDLGDKCDIVSNEMRKSYESRIIEVREVFKEGQHEVEAVFGDKIPTIYERMRNL